MAQCSRTNIRAVGLRYALPVAASDAYAVIDFVAVLIGYAISGERTLEAFYERLLPWAAAFMALFGRDHLPVRSTLSRFLAALTPEPVEALRRLFLSDLLARPLVKEEQPGPRNAQRAVQLQGSGFKTVVM